MERLLKSKRNINKKLEPLNRTPLHLLCFGGDYNKTKYLLTQSYQYCDTNIKDSKGQTPLHLSIQPIHAFHTIQIVSLLLSMKKVKINDQDSNGHTPLHIACIIMSEELIELLLKKKAFIHIKDNKEKLPIDYLKDEVYIKIIFLMVTFLVF
jgi:ankyrin repeat protein